MVLREKLAAGLVRVLESAGRDPVLVDTAVSRFRAELLESAGLDEWSDELRAYYLHEFAECLRPLVELAAGIEEYEWADRLHRVISSLVESGLA